MTTYIMLINWTEQGIRDVKSSPKRLDAARKLLGEMGGTLKAFYLTMGEFDMVVVAEAPDDAVDISLKKGIQLVDEQGERMFG